MPATPGPDRLTLDPQSLKALAHPLRVRLIGLLREEGPSTATRLAERLGQSSGATSYHLRQLAVHGFVAEDDSRTGGGRERWWKAVHRSTLLPRAQIRETPIEGEGFLRAVAEDNYRHIDRFVNEVVTLPPEWDDGSMMSDWILRLTAEQAAELRWALIDIAERAWQYRPEDEAPPDAERVVLQIQMLPQLRNNPSDTNEGTE